MTLMRLPFFHISWILWNGPERSRARWFCAAQRTLDGEDRSASCRGKEREPLAVLIGAGEQASLPPVLQPVTFTSNVDGCGMMQQPIQNRGGDDGIAKDRSPNIDRFPATSANHSKATLTSQRISVQPLAIAPALPSGVSRIWVLSRVRLQYTPTTKI
jgi:hypothetical protein